MVKPDASYRNLQLARALDRICTHPGRYEITVTIPPYPSQPWELSVSRIEHLRNVTLQKRPP